MFYNRVVMTDAERHISPLPWPVIPIPPCVLNVWVPVCEKDSPGSPVHYLVPHFPSLPVHHAASFFTCARAFWNYCKLVLCRNTRPCPSLMCFRFAASHTSRGRKWPRSSREGLLGDRPAERVSVYIPRTTRASTGRMDVRER